MELFTRHPDADWSNVRRETVQIARERGVSGGQSAIEPVVDQVLWDLIVERILSLGSSSGQAEARYPFLYITEMGKAIASGQEHLYDPDEYVGSLRHRVPTLDAVVAQYLLGGDKGSPIRRLVVKRHTPPFVFSFFFSYPTES